MLRWRNHEMGDDAGHAGDFSNHICGEILYAFGENDAADVNFAKLATGTRDDSAVPSRGQYGTTLWPSYRSPRRHTSLSDHHTDSM